MDGRNGATICDRIDAPERLLFVTEGVLKRIPDIGKVSFEEIMRYRTVWSGPVVPGPIAQCLVPNQWERASA
jgi:hypothetical protein